jgi:hypothetical protein
VGTSGRSPAVGDGKGDRGPDMLMGVRILETDAIDEVRSCLIGFCGTGIAVVSGDIWEPMMLY